MPPLSPKSMPVSSVASLDILILAFSFSFTHDSCLNNYSKIKLLNSYFLDGDEKGGGGAGKRMKSGLLEG